MTPDDPEFELTITAIDAGYSHQVDKLFGVLCAASLDEIQSGTAIERFLAGLQRAVSLRGACREGLDQIDLDLIIEHPT